MNGTLLGAVVGFMILILAALSFHQACGSGSSKEQCDSFLEKLADD